MGEAVSLEFIGRHLTELHGEMRAMRSEMRDELHVVRGEIREFKLELRDFRAELREVRTVVLSTDDATRRLRERVADLEGARP